MTDYAPRLFADDAAVRAIADGLIDRSLPRERWTHEAHLAACLTILRERPGIIAERDLPGIIASYNEAVGGQNTDDAGYHETITQLYIRAVRAYLAAVDRGQPLVVLVNRLLASAMGLRRFPLAYYSRTRLFSVEARRGWVDPDRRALDFDWAFSGNHAVAGELETSDD